MESKPGSSLLIDDIHQNRKITMTKYIIIIAIIILIPLGILNINNNNLVVGVLDISFAGILAVMLFFFINEEYYTRAAHTGIFIAGVFFFYFFMNKSVSNTGHLWIFAFPLFSFFILGCRGGLWASSLLLSAIITYLLLQHRLPFGFEPYPFTFSARMIPSYLLVLIYAYLFENLREKSLTNAHLKNIELEQAVDQLRVKEDELSDILEGTNAGTWDWKIQTGELTLNQRWAEIMGCTLEDLEPIDINTWRDNVHPDDLPGVNAILDKHFSGKLDYYDVLFRQPHKRSGWVWVNARGKVVKWGKDGKPLRLSGIHLDITERKKAEAEKLIAQKIASEQEQFALVGQVAGKIAHDFNNILGIIMGNTELALLDCQEPQTKKILELVFEQGIRGKNLTKNLVAFAKDQEPKQELFKISEKIELVLNLMRKDLEGIELRNEESPGVPELIADPGMIEHVLINLIQNSIHALSMVEYPRITFRTYSHDNHICFGIEDNGCGISKENLENIYEPSYTLKGSKDVTGSYKGGIKGTGYGMTNVKKYIELHKGNISVESELRSGTKFTICLPIIKKELTSKEKIKLQNEIKHFEKNILLVEDEKAISDVQYRILTDEPCRHNVDIAVNGQVAMDLFNRNKYDFVSLDYVLPGGISGMDVYHHIRKTNKTVPVLFVSGNIEFLESIKEMKQKDVYIDHLSKPCRNIDYMNGINKLLEKALAQQ